MKTTRILSLGIFCLLLTISLINAIDSLNAQTLVAGKVYDSSFSSTISGVYVEVRCNSGLLNNTYTLEDGTYAIRFEENVCNLGDNIEVNAKKAELTGSGNGVIARCENNNCTDNYFSIINLNIQHRLSVSGNINTGNTGSGGYGGGFYLCGNGKCDSGESVNTCPTDCKKTTQTNSATSKTTSSSGTITDESKDQTTDITLINENRTDSNNPLTGAVIGTSNSVILFFAVLSFVIILCLLITFKIIRKY